MTKVLIIAPHPDDAELAMGGTIVKMIDAGWKVTILDLTDGEPTPHGSKEIRSKETDAASTVLGIKQRTCLGMPNRYLRASLRNRTSLAETIRVNRPDIIFGPQLPDWHPDHVAAASLIRDARFHAKLHKTNMAGLPHWTSMQFGYFSPHRDHYPTPSFVIDITDQWERKINSINAYQSQIRNSQFADGTSVIDNVEIICRYFGHCAGVKFGEPFFSQGPLCIKQIQLLV
jgi:N-acetylglucosamine malate deacetylase 1